MIFLFNQTGCAEDHKPWTTARGACGDFASPSFFIVSDKRQIRTNRLLPKGSDYFDLVEMMGLEPTAYALRTHRSTSWATSPSFDIIANGEKKDKRLRAFFRKSFAKHWSRFEAARFGAAVVLQGAVCARRGLQVGRASSRFKIKIPNEISSGLQANALRVKAARQITTKKVGVIFTKI